MQIPNKLDFGKSVHQYIYSGFNVLTRLDLWDWVTSLVSKVNCWPFKTDRNGCRSFETSAILVQCNTDLKDTIHTEQQASTVTVDWLYEHQPQAASVDARRWGSVIGDQNVYFYFSKDLNITIKRHCHTLSFIYHCHVWKLLFWYATLIFIVQ